MQADSTGRSWLANPYLLLTLAPLFWGGNAVIGKLATSELNAIELTFFRWVLGVVIIGLIAWRHLVKDWPLIRRHWPRLFVMGATGFAGFNIVLYWALHYTTAINVSIAQAAIPVVIMLLNGLLLGQRVFALQVLGAVLAIFGVVYTVTAGEPSQLLAGELNRGDAMMMLAVLFYAAYSVSLRNRPPIHDLSLIFSLAVASLVVVAPMMIWNVSDKGLVDFSWSAGLIILYVAIFPSFLAQLFFAKGVGSIGANRGGIFINLVPVFGALLAVLVVGEPFEFYHLLGLILVLAGIGMAEWIVRYKARRLRTDDEAGG